LVGPQSQDGRTEDGDAVAPNRSDRWVPVRPMLYRSDRCATTQSGIFEAKDTRRDRKARVETKRVAVTGHPSDGAMTKISDFALEGHVSLAN
jgi:hypothetical protein